MNWRSRPLCETGRGININKRGFEASLYSELSEGWRLQWRSLRVQGSLIHMIGLMGVHNSNMGGDEYVHWSSLLSPAAVYFKMPQPLEALAPPAPAGFDAEGTTGSDRPSEAITSRSGISFSASSSIVSMSSRSFCGTNMRWIWRGENE